MPVQTRSMKKLQTQETIEENVIKENVIVKDDEYLLKKKNIIEKYRLMVLKELFTAKYIEPNPNKRTEIIKICEHWILFLYKKHDFKSICKIACGKIIPLKNHDNQELITVIMKYVASFYIFKTLLLNR